MKKSKKRRCLCDVGEGGSPRICKVHSSRGDMKAPRESDWDNRKKPGAKP